MATIIPFDSVRLTQRLAWRTSILQTYSGLESRVAERRRPRETWDIQFAVDLELDRRYLRSELFADSVNPWLLPLHHERRTTQNAVTSTSATIDATYVDWVTDGQAVYVVGTDPADAYETTIVSSTGPTAAKVLTLAAGPGAGDFPAGGTRVMPVARVLLDDGQGTGRSGTVGTTAAAQRDVGAGTWSMKALTSTPVPVVGTGATVVSFDGIPVLDRLVVVEADPEEKFQNNLRRFDYGGSVVQESSWPSASVTRSHRFRGDGPPDLQWWKKFLVGNYGRQVAFLLPTWQPDLDLHSQPAGGTTVVVEQNPGFLVWFSKPPHRWLQLLKVDGSVQYVKASGVVDNMDGTETITTTTTVTGPDVERVSLMELVRLAEDEVAIEHSMGDYFYVTLGVVGVQR